MFEWWQWLVCGLVLVMMELFVPSLFMIWFGAGAAAVALFVYLAPEMHGAGQFFLWAILSAAFTFAWFRWLKPKTVSQAGAASAEALGEIGVLVSELHPDSRGKVRFQKPLFGAEVWECYADHPVPAGERVRVVAVEGHFIKVERAK